MSAPKPAAYRDSLERLIALAFAANREYERIYELGHSPGGTPPGRVSGCGRHVADEDGATCILCGATIGIGETDPTGDVAVSAAKAVARKAAHVSHERLLDAIGDATAALVVLKVAYPKDRDTYDETIPHFATVVTRAEMAEAREAARKRKEAGEM